MAVPNEAPVSGVRSSERASGPSAGTGTEKGEGGARPANASDYCPACSQALQSKSCKLVCPSCGYYMSCSDFY